MTKQSQWITVIALMAVMMLGFFLYRFNLEQSYVVKGDTARDLLTVLRLYQQKRLTLIGPPVSLGQYGTRELYFGSLHYYLGMAGLIVGHFKIPYATLTNTLLMVAAIPAFFLLSACCVKQRWQRLLLTLLCAAGPVTVLHTRIFWNPSAIIALSVFFWLCVYYSYIKKITYVWALAAGAIAGIIFNLHYFAALPLFIVPLFRIAQWKKVLVWFVAGILLTSLPLLLFETRHEWYLTYGFIHHLLTGTDSGRLTLLERLQRIDFGLLVPFGIYQGEFYFSPLAVFPRLVTVMFSLGITVAVARWINRSSFLMCGMVALVVGLIVTAFTSGAPQYFMRYLFAVYPLLLLYVGAALMKNWVTFVVFVMVGTFAIATSLHIVNTPADSRYGYLSIATLEKASRVILRERNIGTYNITENIIGDARATALRYFFERDSVHKPQSETQYENLDTLFVLTQNVKKAAKEKRWEFTATQGLQKAKQVSLGNSTWIVVYRR